MEPRMATLNKIKTSMELESTHSCPSCGEGAFCAMEAGYSINLCWCFYEGSKGLPSTDTGICLCKGCLGDQ